MGGEERILVTDSVRPAAEFVLWEVFEDGMYYLGAKQEKDGYPIRFRNFKSGRDEAVAFLKSVPVM